MNGINFSDTTLLESIQGIFHNASQDDKHLSKIKAGQNYSSLIESFEKYSTEGYLVSIYPISVEVEQELKSILMSLGVNQDKLFQFHFKRLLANHLDYICQNDTYFSNSIFNNSPVISGNGFVTINNYEMQPKKEKGLGEYLKELSHQSVGEISSTDVEQECNTLKKIGFLIIEKNKANSFYIPVIVSKVLDKLEFDTYYMMSEEFCITEYKSLGLPKGGLIIKHELSNLEKFDKWLSIPENLFETSEKLVAQGGMLILVLDIRAQRKIGHQIRKYFYFYKKYGFRYWVPMPPLFTALKIRLCNFLKKISSSLKYHQWLN